MTNKIKIFKYSKLVLKILILVLCGLLLITSSYAVELIDKRHSTKAETSLDSISFTSEFTSYANTSVFTISKPSGLTNLAKLVNTGCTYQKQTDTDKDGNPKYTTYTTTYNFSGKTIKLTSDISLSSHTIIGSREHSFCGNFDGQGHCISNLNISSPVYGDGVGLFGLYAGSYIKNLQIKAGTITTTETENQISPVGCLIGHAISTSLEISSVGVVANKIIAYSTYRGTRGSYGIYSNPGNAFCGGLIGRNDGVLTIKNCSVYVKDKMEAYAKYGFASCGGLVGLNKVSSLTVSYCVVSAGTMKASADSQPSHYDADGMLPMYQYCSCLGGLCGMCTSSWAGSSTSYANPINATISSCYVVVSNFTCSSNTGMALVQPMVAGSIGNVKTGSWIDFGTHQWLIVTTTKCYYKANFTNVHDGSTYKSD